MKFTSYIQSIKVVLINALITFVEAGAAALLVSDGLSKAALAGAAGTAASVVWNTVIKPYLKSQQVLYK